MYELDDKKVGYYNLDEEFNIFQGEDTLIFENFNGEESLVAFIGEVMSHFLEVSSKEEYDGICESIVMFVYRKNGELYAYYNNTEKDADGNGFYIEKIKCKINRDFRFFDQVMMYVNTEIYALLVETEDEDTYEILTR